MTRKILFFDTETTGLPTNYDAAVNDIYNWPRIIQLAWQLCDENANILNKVTEYVLPEGFDIPRSEFHIKHGLTNETCKMFGVPISGLLDRFILDLNECDEVVAHNMSFDKPIIECEMYRYQKVPATRAQAYCTKLGSMDIVKLPGFKGRYKWPSLDEAYQHFFKSGFTGAHDAGNDVEACKKIYFAINVHNAKKLALLNKIL